MVWKIFHGWVLSEPIFMAGVIFHEWVLVGPFFLCLGFGLVNFLWVGFRITQFLVEFSLIWLILHEWICVSQLLMAEILMSEPIFFGRIPEIQIISHFMRNRQFFPIFHGAKFQVADFSLMSEFLSDCYF